jgi:hypothetical protein
MSDFTEEMGKGIKKALGVDAFNSASDALSGAVGNAKSFLTGSPAPSTGADPGMVQEANQSFVNKTKDTPKTPAAPKAPVKTPSSKKPSYKDGTDYVPKTGDAKLHKGEAVLKKDDADKFREAKVKNSAMSSIAEDLGGHADKPAKVIKHVIVRKAKNKDGKHINIHTHVHTHPEAHPDEEHVTEGNDGLAEHMLEHQGEPNPGEAEAEAGQSGIPGAAPAAGAPAGAPAGPMPAGA